MSIAYTMIDEGTADPDAASALTGGQGARALAAFAPSRVAAQIGVDQHVISELAHELGDKKHRPALVMGGGPAAAQANGLFNMMAVYALNALVGSVNRSGGLVFNPEPISGRIRTTSLRDWKKTLDDMRSGDITTVLVREADLAYGLPGALDARSALRSVDTIVSFSSFLDETSELADLILPCHTPLEEWGTDEPNPGPGYTTIGFQQPAVNHFHETLSFGDVLLQTGIQLGVSDLPGENMREAVRSLAMELHERKRGSVVQPTFAEFWKRILERGGWWDTRATADGSRPPLPALPSSAPQVTSADPKRYPLHLVPFEGIGIGAGQYAHLPWAQSVPDPITTATWGLLGGAQPPHRRRDGSEEQRHRDRRVGYGPHHPRARVHQPRHSTGGSSRTHGAGPPGVHELRGPARRERAGHPGTHGRSGDRRVCVGRYPRPDLRHHPATGDPEVGGHRTRPPAPRRRTHSRAQGIAKQDLSWRRVHRAHGQTTSGEWS